MIVVGITSTGHSHKRDGLECDDYVYYLVDEDNNFLVFAVCDGAGSAKFGNIGAKIASKSFCKFIFENKDKYDIKNLIGLGLIFARKSLQDYASEKGCNIGDLGTTLSGGVYKDGKLVCVLIGDSPLFVIDENNKLFYPDDLAKGEYINETVFLTSNRWKEYVSISDAIHNPKAIISCTDGLNKFLFITKKIKGKWTAEPLKKNIVKYINNFIQHKDKIDYIKEELKKYLDSEECNKINDDDKGLFIGIFTDELLDEEKISLANMPKLDKKEIKVILSKDVNNGKNKIKNDDSTEQGEIKITILDEDIYSGKDKKIKDKLSILHKPKRKTIIFILAIFLVLCIPLIGLNMFLIFNKPNINTSETQNSINTPINTKNNASQESNNLNINNAKTNVPKTQNSSSSDNSSNIQPNFNLNNISKINIRPVSIYGEYPVKIDNSLSNKTCINITYPIKGSYIGYIKSKNKNITINRIIGVYNYSKIDDYTFLIYEICDKNNETKNYTVELNPIKSNESVICNITYNIVWKIE